MGIGLGMAMQILILIVQNTFPNAEVGTATASNNYFRQIGASIGSAVVGSVFVAQPQAPGGDAPAERGRGIVGWEPQLVHAREGAGAAEAVKHIIVGAYNDALTPVFLYLVPLMLVATVLLFFVKEKPLATTIDREPAAL
ncbi:MAG: hypothetical protein WDM88_00365 [Galbitalea sp.]